MARVTGNKELSEFAQEALSELYIYEQKKKIRAEMGDTYALPSAYHHAHQGALTILEKRDLVKSAGYKAHELTQKGAELAESLPTIEHMRHEIRVYRHKCLSTLHSLQAHSELQSKVIGIINQRFDDKHSTEITYPPVTRSDTKTHYTLDFDNDRAGWLLNLRWWHPHLEVVARLDCIGGDYFIRLDGGEFRTPQEHKTIDDRISAMWEVIKLLESYTLKFDQSE